MNMKKMSRILCALVCVVMLFAVLPTRAQAGWLPTVDISESSGTHFFHGFATPLYVKEGTTSGKTCVYYEWNGQIRYLNKSGAAGDDLSGSVIWAGHNTAGYNGGATSVTVYSGSIGSIYGGSANKNCYVNSTSIAIHGGTVRNVTMGGYGDVKNSVSFIQTGGSITGSIDMYGMDGSTTNGWKYLFISGGTRAQSGIQNASDSVWKFTDGNWGVNGMGRVPAGCTMNVQAGKKATIGDVTSGTNHLSVYGDLIVNGTVYNYGTKLTAEDVTSGSGMILNLSHVTANVTNYKTIMLTPQDGYFLPSLSDISVTTMDGEAINTWSLSGGTLTLPDYVSARGAIVTVSAGTPAASLTVDGVTTNHATLQDAYDASQGSGLITVLKDISGVEYGIDITDSGDTVNLIVDLNGHTVEATKDAISVYGGDTVTVRSSKSGGKLIGGVCGITGYGVYTIENCEVAGGLCGVSGMSVTIKSGSVSSTRGYSDYAVAATDSATVEGGTISGCMGINASVDAQVSISGGTINATAIGIKAEDGSHANGTLSITGGTINAPTDIDLADGAGYTVSVSGGTFTDGLTVSGEGRTVQSILAPGKACYAGDAIVNLAADATTTGSDTVVVKTADLKDAIVELDLPEGGYTYNSDEKKPAIKSITLGGVALTEDHYSISYENNTDAGEASVVLTAKEPYTGTKTVTFDIAPYEVKSSDLEFVDSTITKEYDGNTGSTAAVQIKAGTFGNADPVAVTGTAAYNSKDVATATTATFTPDAVTTGNYTISADQTLSGPASITPRTLTVINAQVEDKMYDGSAAATVKNYGQLEGVVDGETVQLITTNVTAVFADKNVGENKTVTLEGYQIGANANYQLAQKMPGVTASITVAELTLTNVTVKDEHLSFMMMVSMIDPTVNPYADTTTATVNGLVPSDDVQVGCTTWYQKLVTGDAVPVVCKFTLSGTDSGNYVITKIGGADVTAEDGVYSYTTTGKVTCDYVATQGVEYTVTSNDWINTDFAVTANEGYALVPGDFPFDQFDASKPRNELIEMGQKIMDGVPVQTGETDADGDSVSFYVVDGNTFLISQETTETYKIDKTVPVIAEPDRQAAGWQLTAEYTFQVTDEKAGVAEVTVVDGDNAAVVLTNNNGVYSFTADKNTTYTITAKDAAGNEQTATVTEESIDSIVPTITAPARAKEGWQAQVDYTFTVSDSQSGIDKVLASVGGQALFELFEGADGKYTITVDDNVSFTIAVKDKMGNTVTATVTEAMIDTQAPSKPELTGSNSALWTNEEITVSAESTDSQSGIAAYWYAAENAQFPSDAWKKLTVAANVGTVAFAEEQNAVYYVIAEDAVGLVSEAATVEIRIDKTLPTAQITIGERVWNTWLGEVVFDAFTNKDQTVTITAQDALSGVDKVEYLESAEAMTLDALKTSNKWKTGTSVNVTAEHAKQFVYYARITDKAGNVAYISSDGTVFDTVAPTVSGVINGSTYYTTQVVTVEDGNLASITLNGQSAASPITLAGNTDAEYTVIAKDKAGNETKVTVTMKPIAALAPVTSQKTLENVTGSDEETIRQELAALESLDTTNSSDAEKDALDQLAQKAEGLLERIDEARAAVNTVALQNAKEITGENVRMDDEDTLNQAAEDLEEALEDYAGNLTDREQELEELAEQIEDALQVITNAKEVQDLIDALPNTAEPDDENAIAQVEDVHEALDALTEYEKSLVDTEKLEELIEILTDYKLTKGNGVTWKSGDGDLELIANGPYSKFISLLVDGKEVDAEDYTAVSGSTVITLKESFLEELKADKHTVTVRYSDGEAGGEFTVEETVPPTEETTPSTEETTPSTEATKPPQNGSATTGDQAKPVLLIAIAGVSLVAIIVLIILAIPKKKGKYEKSK